MDTLPLIEDLKSRMSDSDKIKLEQLLQHYHNQLTEVDHQLSTLLFEDPMPDLLSFDMGLGTVYFHTDNLKYRERITKFIENLDEKIVSKVHHY